MAIRHSITLSTSEPNNEVGNLKIRQGDEQTQTLVANITENGVPKPFVGLQPFFCAKLGQTAGLGIIEQKVTGPMNPANGTLEYIMQPEDWQQIGRQTAYFSFRKMVNDHEWTEQFSTRDFNYNVIKSAFSEGLREVKKDGSTYVWTIEDMLRLFDEYIASGKTDWEEFVEQNREVLESVDPGGKLIGELIDARRPFGGDAYPTLGERLDSEKAEVSAQLAQMAQDLTGREINIMYPPPPLVGAKMDGETDDTQAIQNLINSLTNSGTGQGRIIVPKGIAMISNLILPPAIVLVGVGRHTSILRGIEGSSGKMITDSGNAAKIIIANLQLDGNNQNYTKLLDLGNNDIPFGTEGFLENLYARDCPSATAYDINGNVSFINKLSAIYCKSGLILRGAANRIRDFVTLGNTEYGISNRAHASSFDGIEIEAPASSAMPFHHTANDLIVNGILVSIGNNTHINNLIVIESTELRFSITGISVSLKAGASYGAKILHGSLQFLKNGDYESKSFNFNPETVQLFRVNEAIASVLTNRTVEVEQYHPAMLIGVENDIASDVTVDLKGVTANTQGKRYIIQNNSSTKTAWVKGINSRFVIVGNQNISMDTSVGFPVRPRAQLILDIATGHLSQVIAQYSGTYGAIGSYPTTGKWFAGEVIYNQSNQLGVSKYYAKQCIQSGDYAMTPPVWEFINRV